GHGLAGSRLAPVSRLQCRRSGEFGKVGQAGQDATGSTVTRERGNLMKTRKQVGIVRTARWALGAAVLCCAFGAQAAGELKLANAVFQEVEVTTEDGRTELRQAPVTRVIPGTEVIYVIDYSNAGDGPVAD